MQIHLFMITARMLIGCDALTTTQPGGTLQPDSAASGQLPSLSTPLQKQERSSLDENDDDSDSDGSADLEGYDLCSMCQAMFTRGRCSTAEKATMETVSQVRAGITRGVKFYSQHKIKSSLYLDPPMEGHALYRVRELQCRDDSALWWDSCSKLDCMNNMEGIDSKCKYRIANYTENPLEGSAEMMMRQNKDFFFNMTKGSPMPSLFTMAYFHSHCGSGFDRRMVWLGCHFPAKRWCSAAGFSFHIRAGCTHTYRCNGSVPCLWGCGGTGSEAPNWLAPYESVGNVLDTVLPRECTQPDISGLDGDGLDPESFQSQIRASSCQPSRSTSAIEDAHDVKIDQALERRSTTRPRDTR